MKNFCFPLLLIVWGGTIIFFCGISVNIYDKFDEHVCDRNRTIQEDINFYDDVCTNVTKVASYGLWDACIQKSHSKHKSVYRLALVDIANEYGLCYGIRCEDFFLQSLYLLPMLFTSLTIVVMIFLLCGCMIFRYGMKQDARYDMPQRSPAYEKNMDTGYSDSTKWLPIKWKSKLT